MTPRPNRRSTKSMPTCGCGGGVAPNDKGLGPFPPSISKRPSLRPPQAAALKVHCPSEELISGLTAEVPAEALNEFVFELKNGK